MNLSDYKGIAVFAEQRDGQLQNVGLELLGKARELAENLDTKEVTADINRKRNRRISKRINSFWC